MNGSGSWFSRRSHSMRMAKRPKLCNSWARRWHWQSRAASFGSLWTKGSRWRCCWLRWLLRGDNAGLHRQAVGCLCGGWGHEHPADTVRPASPAAQPLIEPLTEHELEVLRLIAQGLSNQEIGERLFLALDTVSKGHNRHIFDKLLVQRRTEAITTPTAWVCCNCKCSYSSLHSPLSYITKRQHLQPTPKCLYGDTVVQVYYL